MSKQAEKKSQAKARVKTPEPPQIQNPSSRDELKEKSRNPENGQRDDGDKSEKK